MFAREILLNRSNVQIDKEEKDRRNHLLSAVHQIEQGRRFSDARHGFFMRKRFSLFSCTSCEKDLANHPYLNL